jgi:hypothetical protein
MKSTNLIKILDLCGQLLMLLPLLLPDDDFGWSNVTLTYCTVGSWQLISLVANWYGNPGGRPRRATYAMALRGFAWIAAMLGPLTLIALFYGASSGFVSCIATFLAGGLRLCLYALFFVAPGFAAWYFCICVRELRDYRAAAIHRREIHWKL